MSKKGTRFTQSELDEIKSLHKEGYSYRVIADKLGRSRNAIGNKIKTLDMSEKNINSVGLSFRERKAIEKLRGKGYSCAQIGNLLGRGKNTIAVELRKGCVNGKYSAKVGEDYKNTQKILRKKRVSDQMKDAISEGKYFNPYQHLKNKIEGLESLLEVVLEELKEIRNERNKND